MFRRVGYGWKIGFGIGLLLDCVMLDDDGGEYGVGDGSGEDSGEGNGGFGGGTGLNLEMVDNIGGKWTRLVEWP